MGRRGPAPKPTKLKILHGNPGLRALNAREPQPRLGVPGMPTWLDKEGRAEWRRLVPELARLGLLAKIDRGWLAAGCQWWSVFIRASRALRETGLDPKDRRRIVSEANDAYRNYTKAAAEFGLSPASRSRIEVVPPEAEDDLEKWESEYQAGIDRA